MKENIKKEDCGLSKTTEKAGKHNKEGPINTTVGKSGDKTKISLLSLMTSESSQFYSLRKYVSTK